MSTQRTEPAQVDLAEVLAYVRSYAPVLEDGYTIYGPYQDASDLIADGIESRFAQRGGEARHDETAKGAPVDPAREPDAVPALGVVAIPVIPIDEEAQRLVDRLVAENAPQSVAKRPLQGRERPLPTVDRAWLNTTWLELRAQLESALMLIDRIAEFAHNEECDSFNDCENVEGDLCVFDEELDETVHDHVSCDCRVWDAATMAKNIRTVLDRTTPPAWRRAANATRSSSKGDDHG